MLFTPEQILSNTRKQRVVFRLKIRETNNYSIVLKTQVVSIVNSTGTQKRDPALYS